MTAHFLGWKWEAPRDTYAGPGMTTYSAALAAARQKLQRAGSASAGLDARLLLADAAALEMAALIAKSGEELPALAESAFDAHLKRRLAGEPVARILGGKEFWGLPFLLNEATLVPRPETEILVETVLAEASSRFSCPPRICDLGTGSGAIIVSLLSELPGATGAAVDISPVALQAARRNAERLGVSERISFYQADFSDGPEGPFDIVVSNPPYIASAAIAGLAPEVRDHDPRLALDGGPDGLAAYRAIVARLGVILKQSGLVALEIGFGQAEAVAALCRAAGLREVAIRADLSGVSRVVAAVRPRPEPRNG